MAEFLGCEGMVPCLGPVGVQWVCETLGQHVGWWVARAGSVAGSVAEGGACPPVCPMHCTLHNFLALHWNSDLSGQGCRASLALQPTKEMLLSWGLLEPPRPPELGWAALSRLARGVQAGQRGMT